MLPGPTQRAASPSSHQPVPPRPSLPGVPPRPRPRLATSVCFATPTWVPSPGSALHPRPGRNPWACRHTGGACGGCRGVRTRNPPPRLIPADPAQKSQEGRDPTGGSICADSRLGVPSTRRGPPRGVRPGTRPAPSQDPTGTRGPGALLERRCSRDGACVRARVPPGPCKGRRGGGGGGGG